MANKHEKAGRLQDPDYSVCTMSYFVTKPVIDNCLRTGLGLGLGLVLATGPSIYLRTGGGTVITKSLSPESPE